MHMNDNFANAAPLGSLYAEWSYDHRDGKPVCAFQHIADWQEDRRLKRARKQATQAIERRRNGRAYRG